MYITSLHNILRDLMVHKATGWYKGKKMTPKEAWDDGLDDGHSGMSAAYVALAVYNFSPRGEEFKKWCMKPLCHSWETSPISKVFRRNWKMIAVKGVRFRLSIHPCFARSSIKALPSM